VVTRLSGKDDASGHNERPEEAENDVPKRPPRFRLERDDRNSGNHNDEKNSLDEPHDSLSFHSKRPHPSGST